MSDPLVALQQAIKSKATVTYELNGEKVPSLSSATHISIPPNHLFSKSTATRFRKPGTSATDPLSKPQDFYSIEAIYLAWHFQTASGAEYMRQARDSGLAVGFVGLTDRKTVVDWLEGGQTHSDRIVYLASTTPPGSPRASGGALPSSSHKPIVQDASTSPTKRRYVPDTQDVEAVKKIKANEIELRDRNTVLRGTKPTNFSAVCTLYSEKLKKLKEASKPGAAPAAATPAPTLDAKMQARKARNMYPIIMISSSPTALITMHNVKRFLQEAIFEPSQDAKARAAAEGNTRPEDLIAIYRKRTHIDSSGKETETNVRYFVVDSTEALAKFGNDAWDRVVCVMTTGQAWQFRPYKWSDPRQLFHHVKGIYVSWSNDPPNTKIKDWNVTELKIDPHRRHVDKSVVAHFWKLLDSWMMANKPGLSKS
ncbi:hypothetical protein HGRIS_013827 [Hohenbuehelia grisea]|uniref:Cell division control protein 73 C-terminal domain-containing protein n=1 Tax=Hohenbuehelia grisea TaxID=104357 RepID=A0ABR3IWX7_9AGAR